MRAAIDVALAVNKTAGIWCASSHPCCELETCARTTELQHHMDAFQLYAVTNSSLAMLGKMQKPLRCFVTKNGKKLRSINPNACVCAGSSAGSAAAVAARFAPWSLCEDTGGSCRAPAIANGIFGLRPTLGCYNYSDALVLATFTRDTVGMWVFLILYCCPVIVVVCSLWCC